MSEPVYYNTTPTNSSIENKTNTVNTTRNFNITVNAMNNQEKLVGTLLIVSIFIILIRTFVIHGIFTTTVPVLLLILIGWLLQMSGYQDKCIKRNFNSGDSFK